MPHYQRWWEKELNELKAELRKLSRLFYDLRGDPHNPVHPECQTARETYPAAIRNAKSEHWEGFLATAAEHKLWVANCYLSKPARDAGCARVPTLKPWWQMGL
ncbi:hypothetical protein BDV98DRAFT_636111 [Pterulicium gracile]|uniref:Uncharacterized protein n=1 Tax=Pterulicium gracile TaxID=1884261 RepID=A0A5C3Q5X8_9AGAR|nr:hypothetical protein BDV98DRAFT_636111 [Pterula gracilis]